MGNGVIMMDVVDIFYWCWISCFGLNMGVGHHAVMWNRNRNLESESMESKILVESGIGIEKNFQVESGIGIGIEKKS